MNKTQQLTGKVVSGVQQGSYFTSLDWVQKQCMEKLGFKPYLGTLNLEVSSEYLPIIEQLQQAKGVELNSSNPNFCDGKAFPVSLGEVHSAIIIPAEEVRVHGKNIIEIIAPVRLKDALGVEDGDVVIVNVNIPDP